MSNQLAIPSERTERGRWSGFGELARGWKRNWPDARREPIEDILTAEYRFDSDYESHGGAIDFESYGYFREAFELVADPRYRKITLVCATQLGKTTWMLASLVYLHLTTPAPTLLLTPNEDQTLELRDRMYANLKASPTLRHLTLPVNPRSARIVAPVYLAWSGSASRMRSRPCKYVAATEVDIYRTSRGGNPIKAMEGRTKDFAMPKILIESSPIAAESMIIADYNQGDRRRLWHRCPICGHDQVLRFFKHRDGPYIGAGGLAGFRNEDESFKSDDEIRADTYYLCERGCEIPESARIDLLGQYEWCRDGEYMRDGIKQGSPKKPGDHASIWLWSIASRKLTFRKLALEYKSHYQQNVLSDFYKDWLAIEMSSMRRTPKYQRVGARLSGTHERGEVWPDSYFVTSFVDVQEHGIYYVVRSWGINQRSWLVDWGYLRRYDDDGYPGGRLPHDLQQAITLVWGKRWQVALGRKNKSGADLVGCKLCGIDIGYQKRVSDVANAIASIADTAIGIDDRVRATVGDTQRVSAVARWRERKANASIPIDRYWAVNVDVFKEELMEWIIEGVTGANPTFILTADVTKLGRDYLQQLVNEELREKQIANKRSKREWTVISHRIGNHYWDCEVGCQVLANMVLAELGLDWTGTGWDELTLAV